VWGIEWKMRELKAGRDKKIGLLKVSAMFSTPTTTL
jgi:hypothetical protein